jgi:putative hydrolase of the HAD superfamily
MPHKSLQGIEAVIFDLGGTLVKLPAPLFEYHRRYLQEVCGAEFNVSDEALVAAQDAANRAIGEYFLQSNVRVDYSLSSEDWFHFNYAFLNALGISENLKERAKQYGRLWDELLRSNPDVLIKGTKEVLEELSNRGYKLGVATNWEDPHERLRKLGIISLFQSIQWTLIEGYCKPSPYMLIMNAHDLQVNPLKCAFVGDDIKRDVEAAKRAGMKPILMDREFTENVHMTESYCVIRNLSELLVLLQ